jgi:transposase-like protein
MSKLKRLFAERHFDREAIILCVRRYLRYKLSLPDLVEMMAERGLQLAHTTILRWVHRYAPEFIKRWNRFSRGSGRSWRVDETYIKVRGRWVYLYRAVDNVGNTVDFRLSQRRNVAAAKAFFKKAIRHQSHAPHTITLDGYAASHRAVREMQNADMLPKSPKLRSSKYLNNLVERDHRGIKSRTRPMLSFKNFNSAAITLVGVELLHRIRQGQFALSRLRLKDQAARRSGTQSLLHKSHLSSVPRCDDFTYLHQSPWTHILYRLQKKRIAIHRNGNHIVFKNDLNPMFRCRPQASGNAAI